ncbi:MAG: hypothetical protein MR324_08700 [Lachnospiraceae bacterium]|nr:hypothetical protein [Lachnospiraceae bacterium]
MKTILKNIRNTFFGKIFNIDTVYSLKNVMKSEICNKYPNIEKETYIHGKEIHIAEKYIRENKDIIFYLPYIIDIKTGYYYDLYVGTVPVMQIAYNENIDPKYYGYITETRPINGGKIEIEFNEYLSVK